MAVLFRVYGTVETAPPEDELVDFLEDNGFEDITVETEEVEEDIEELEGWTELLVFEPSLEEPVSIARLVDDDAFNQELESISGKLNGNGTAGEELKELRHTLDNCVMIYCVEIPEEYADHDDTLMLANMVAQFLAQKADGVYCVDQEGFFNDSGDLIYEVAE